MSRYSDSDSRRELDAYRALEMARDGSIPMDTIFKSTGGYRQSVVDSRSNKKKTKKSIVVTFGRFQPPTIGHAKLIKAVTDHAE